MALRVHTMRRRPEGVIADNALAPETRIANALTVQQVRPLAVPD